MRNECYGEAAAEHFAQSRIIGRLAKGERFSECPILLNCRRQHCDTLFRSKGYAR